jgi:hypothetical protein
LEVRQRQIIGYFVRKMPDFDERTKFMQQYQLDKKDDKNNI